MAKLSASLVVKSFFVLLISSLFFVSCAPSISVFIENKTSDNFRIGGPKGRHVKLGEIVFFTNLSYDRDNINNMVASVQLWRAKACLTVLNVEIRTDPDTNLLRSVVTITESDTYDPIFTATSSLFDIGASISDCP